MELRILFIILILPYLSCTQREKKLNEFLIKKNSQLSTDSILYFSKSDTTLESRYRAFETFVGVGRFDTSTAELEVRVISSEMSGTGQHFQIRIKNSHCRVNLVSYESVKDNNYPHRLIGLKVKHQILQPKTECNRFFKRLSSYKLKELPLYKESPGPDETVYKLEIAKNGKYISSLYPDVFNEFRLKESPELNSVTKLLNFLQKEFSE